MPASSSSPRSARLGPGAPASVPGSAPAGRSSAGARSSNRSLAPADKLKREVQAALTDELAQEGYRSGFGKFDGFAYVAAEAYFHLAGGYEAGPPDSTMNVPEWPVSELDDAAMGLNLGLATWTLSDFLKT